MPSPLEAKRWPNGVRCTTCGAKEISRITRKVSKKKDNKRAQLYRCLEPTCKAQFSATTGTIFNGSHLSLDKWYIPIALIVDAKKGMSALQLSRHLKVNYRTAGYLSHRIREAMNDNDAGRNNNGNLKTKTAPSPNQASTGTATVATTYAYDVLNRLTGKS
jgi:hypothetical protein